MEKNKKLLRKIRKHILEEPYRYDQIIIGKRTRKAPCGTAGCIYGWAAVLSGLTDEKTLRNWDKTGYFSNFPTFSKISELLGFSMDEQSIVSDSLGSDWPVKFGERLREAQRKKDKVEEAKAVADYLQYIIRTGEVSEDIEGSV